MSQQPLDQFLNACGLAGPLRLDVLFPGEKVVQRHTFQQPFVLVGRDASSDLCLPDERISKRHAYLQMVSGRLFYIDLGSRRGLECQGRSQVQGWLQPGQTLWIGPYAIRLPDRGRVALPAPTSAEADSRLTQCSLDAPLAPATALRLRGGPISVATAPLQQVFTVLGSVPRCNIRLADPSVSRYHCGLLQTPDGLWVVDLLGRGGTRINGHRVRWARLGPGDRLQVGAFDFELASEPGGAHSGESAGGERTLLEASEVAASPASSFPFSPNGDGWPSAGAIGSVLMPVLNQFSLMQQQMFEQFHQTMLMMVQMFSSLHQEQTQQVREQLDELRAVTRQLDLLRGELANAELPAARGTIPRPGGHALTATGLSSEPPASDPPKLNAPGPDPLAKETSESDAEPSTPMPPAPPTAGPQAQQREISADLHGWLSQRIQALQAERQGRWQRLLATILRK